MPLPLTVSCFTKIQIVVTFLVPAHPGSPGQRAVKRVCVCVSVLQVLCTRLNWFIIWFLSTCKYIPLIVRISTYYLPSVPWRCWLGGRKGIWPVKNWVVGCWHGYLSGARCRLAYGFTFPVPAYQACPGKKPLNGCSSSISYVSHHTESEVSLCADGTAKRSFQSVSPSSWSVRMKHVPVFSLVRTRTMSAGTRWS